jgi:hypothetical protein
MPNTLRPVQPIFVIKLRARPGADGIRALRAILKVLLRRHRLVCIDAREEPSPRRLDQQRRRERHHHDAKRHEREQQPAEKQAI